MIEGIFGKPGKGKTYEAVRRILNFADRGFQCYSVTPINHPNVMLIDYDDITDPFLPPGKILCDEVHLVLSADASRKLTPAWYEKLSQTRKDGHDLLYTSQHESKVLKQLRDNTNYGWICQKYDFGVMTMFAAKCYSMENLRRGKPEERYIHRASNRVYRAYDTRYAIRSNLAVTN